MASRRSSSASKPPAGQNSKIERGVDKCQVFYHSLADKLEALEQSVQPKWLTLEWVSLAVDFMRSTFADMMILFEDVRALMPDVKVSHEYWIEEYMVESMKLLDVCNVLKPAVSRFEHFIMCAQLVVPAMQRCEEDGTLIAALRSCETEVQELVHPPLLVVEPHASSGGGSRWRSTDALLRHASIAIGEKFTDEDVNGSSGGPTTTTIRRNGSARSGRGTVAVALALVMRATRETTDFVASVLIWVLKRDPASHPASTAWQQHLDVFRGDDDGSLWSPSFRRLQERLRKELFEVLRTNNVDHNHGCFVFEELKLVQERTVVVKAEVELGTPSPQRIDALVQDFSNLLDTIQVRLQKVTTHVNQLFDELVQARNKLLDAAQRPGSIHRAHTF